MGGRTSAFAPERQVLRLTEGNTKVTVKRKRTVRVKKQEESDEEDDEKDDYSDSTSKTKPKRQTKAIKKKKVKAETEVKQEQVVDDEIIIKKPVRTVSTRYNFRR